MTSQNTPPRRAHSLKNKLSRIKPLTLTEGIYREVRNAILQGHFEPGQPITIAALAEALGAGAMPVRESVKRLVAEGAFEPQPNRSVRIPVMTRAEFEELVETRCLLEEFAVRKAASLLGDEDMTLIRSLCAAVVVPHQTPESQLEKNAAFHFAIYECSRSRLLVSIIEKLWLRSGPMLIYPLKKETHGHEEFMGLIADHTALVDALAARDPTRAAAAMGRIIEGTANWYRRYWNFPPDGQTAPAGKR